MRTLGRVLEVWEPVFPYRLVGTAAALLQGVELPARDIDILCRDRAAVDQFAAALTQYPALQEPVWLPADRQYFCNFDLNGVEIGIDHDTAETLGTGPWCHFLEVPLGAHRVPAVRLELRLATEMLRRRRDRSEPLIALLRAHGVGERRHRHAHPQRGARQARAGPVAPQDCRRIASNLPRARAGCGAPGRRCCR